MSADVVRRLVLDEYTKREFPGIRALTGWQLGRVLSSVELRQAQYGFAGEIEVPREDSSYVFILFDGDYPWVFTDGPKRTDWPHRHGGVALCMWSDHDPVNQRWVPDDGLADLLFRIRLHLLREAHWIRTGKWPGPEAPHGQAAA